MRSHPHNEKCFFAASNSSHGFQNYYPECFGPRSPVDRLYIIKGGPGTGKSYFMRTMGCIAAEHGYDVTHYYCSSDPSSLDGVICQKDGYPCIGVIDGTAPHVYEPILPGVREEIINLGAFWDSDALCKQGHIIRALCEKKSLAYADAYRFLTACGEVDAVIDTQMKPCIYAEKSARLAERILKDQPDGHQFMITPALLEAVGMTGVVRLNTFERLAQSHPHGEVIYLEDYYGVGYAIMDDLIKYAAQKRLQLWVSWHPVHTHKATALFVPSNRLCIRLINVDQETTVTDARHISLKRYVDADALRKVRGQIRRYEALRDSLLDGAVSCLKSAADHHFALEEIYSTAMDFHAKSIFEQALAVKLFS